MKRMLLVIPLAVILTLACFAPAAEASIVGNVYYFEVSWLQQHYSENSGPTYNAETNGQFRVTVFNITELGGDDVYVYNYNGFDWVGAVVMVDRNDTVAFQDNKVYFSFTTTDHDHDNRSEASSIILYPARSTTHPGRHVFVNPVWSTHSSDWDAAVEEVRDNPTVTSVIDSLLEGTFSFTITVNIEMEVEIDSEDQLVNGTTTFGFSASYDSDGILSSWSMSSLRHLSSENYTGDYSTSMSITRVGSLNGGQLIDGSLLTTVAWIGVAAAAGGVVGVIIGRKM